jgi:dolichyl-phosphate beta-glucosyltransferase
MKDKKISIIIPAYNEEFRIPNFLREMITFSNQNLNDFEVIIVNDGSTDKTQRIVKDVIKGHENYKILSYSKNKGKGHAVYQGVKLSKGNFILFIDADGSIPPREIMKMYQLYKNKKYDVIVGSRILNASDIKNPQPLIRRMFSKFFNIYSNTLFHIKINDLLCGFKGFSRKAAKDIFSDLKSFGWEFDVEILYKSRKNKYEIYQLPIEWRHREGSKIKALDPIFIFINLLELRFRFF